MPKTQPAPRLPATTNRRSPSSASGAARSKAPAGARTADASTASRWRPWAAFIVSLAAFGVSFYLTLAHFDHSAVPLLCSDKGAINCALVTTSPQSEIFGVFPVALLGLIFWTVMLGLNIPFLWRSSWKYMAPLRVAASVTGMGMVLYLVYVELIQLHAICLYCTGVHVLTFILFILVVTGWEDATASRRSAA
jgi:uncharacterized membrane protein